jgi:hypothetical protein
LGDFRVPVNSNIQMTFSRRVKIEQEFGDIDEGDYAAPTYDADSGGANDTGKEANDENQGAAPDADFDIDESNNYNGADDAGGNQKVI